jgi:hypothetical protein
MNESVRRSTEEHDRVSPRRVRRRVCRGACRILMAAWVLKEYLTYNSVFRSVLRKLRAVEQKLRGRQEKFPPARHSVSLRRVKSRPPVGINPTKARAFAEQE